MPANILVAGDEDLVERLRTRTEAITSIGIALALLGGFAILYPDLSTVAATYLIGWVFAIGGATLFLAAFGIHGTGLFIGTLVLSVVTTGVGIVFLTHPDIGAYALTGVIGVVLVIGSIVKLSLLLMLRPVRGSGWILMAAIISLIAGVVILSQLSEASALVLGLLVGLDFLASGIALIMLSRELARAMPDSS